MLQLMTLYANMVKEQKEVKYTKKKFYLKNISLSFKVSTVRKCIKIFKTPVMSSTDEICFAAPWIFV